MKLKNPSCIRTVMLTVITIGIFASAVPPSSNSSVAAPQESQAPSINAGNGKNRDCDINNGSMKVLEDCPPEVIIAQYKKEGVDLVLRGGAYWEVITGQYVNEQDGYTVMLPEGVEALCSPPPAPWHGFFIDVANELPPDAEGSQSHGGFAYYNWDVGITVTGYYNAAEYTSVQELVDFNLKSYYEHAAAVVVTENSPTRLRRIPAIHYVVHFYDPKSGEPMISDDIAAIRSGSVVYEIGLTAPASRYIHEVGALKEVIKGWRPMAY